MGVTEALLTKLGCAEKPILYVYNKCDREASQAPTLPQNVEKENCLFVSAKTGQGLDGLIQRMEELVLSGSGECQFLLPYDEQGMLHRMYTACTVDEVEYREDGIAVRAVCDAKAKGMFRKWMIE